VEAAKLCTAKRGSEIILTRRKALGPCTAYQGSLSGKGVSRVTRPRDSMVTATIVDSKYTGR